VEQQRQADAHADAVHGGEQRLVEDAEAIHERTEARIAVAGSARHLAQVLPRRERPTRSGDDHRVNAGIVLRVTGASRASCHI
jgi:hypothetical protein